MATTPKHIIAILCGGTGPRLWPLSRADNPKQFLSIFSDKSILHDTWVNASKIVPKDDIYVVTNRAYVAQIKKHLPQIKPSHIIAEPEKKNTALALIYFSSIIAKLNPNIVITTLPSDHHITNTNKFTKAIKQSRELTASNQKITLLGKKPTFPNPSYGYIIGSPNIKKFIEKPKGDELNKVFSEGAFWNLGIYTFTPNILQKEIAQTQKQHFPLYQLLFNPKVNQQIVKKVYSQAPNLAIDIAVSELSQNLQVVISDFDWSDIGEWGSIFETLPSTKSSIKSIGTSPSVALNSSNCLISSTSKKIIGLNGVSNLAIIETPDAILVSSLEQSLNVRDLVGKIVSDKKTEKYFLKSHDHKTK